MPTKVVQTEGCRDFKGFRTICEVHRRIQSRLVSRGYDDDDIMSLLDEAFGMGCRLVWKLVDYNLEFEWPKGEEKRLIELKKRLKRVYYADRLATTQ